MKFNPLTKEIYTDNDQFIKKMNCPFKINWDNLEHANSTMRKCENCNHLIVDTEFISDQDILGMVKDKPDTCLKIDLNQKNLKIITNGVLEQK
jgi:hypothetical protein